MTRQKQTRRQFTKTAVAASTLFTAPAFLRARNLNERLDVAVIGTGGRGGSNLRSVESENVVAVCDVCLLYTYPSPRDRGCSRMAASA